MRHDKHTGLLIGILTVLLLATGCGSGDAGLEPREPAMTALNGSSLAGITLDDQGTQLVLTLATVADDGSFIHVELPGERRLMGTQVHVEDSFVGLAVPTAHGADIGVIVLDEQDAPPLRLLLPIGVPDRTASVPPVGDYNVISDFNVSQAGAGQVELCWTQINVGDYNSDGEVGISDLTPIGQLLGTLYDREAPDAAQQRAYWVDGNADGAITISDITAIGQNYGAYIAGYNVRQNGDTLPGEITDGPTVPRAAGTPRGNLPPAFCLVLAGSPSDEWAVVAVDKQGVEGSGSGEIVGDVNLRANIDISGLDLYDLDGSNPGQFGPNKFGTRVIDPIEIIGMPRRAVPALALPVEVNGNSVDYMSLPPGRVLYLDFWYAPTLDLVTGEPKQPSGARSVSAMPGASDIIASVPFTLPTDGSIEMEIAIALSPNPAGGYFSELSVVSLIFGDDPDTPDVEESYNTTSLSRLAFATGLVSYDTDGDGSFDDEAEMADSDLDGVSDARLAHDVDLNLYDFAWQLELKLEGVLASFDEAAGEVVLTGARLTEGEEEEEELPDPLAIRVSELTRFEEHAKTDDGLVKRDIDPSDLAPGDIIEVTLLTLEDQSGLLPTKYWVEKLMRKVDERTGH